MIKIAILSLTTLMMIGCGSGGNSQKIDKNSKVHFGVLSDATLKIYELGGAKKLISSQATTTGDTVANIGNFDTSSITFDPVKFYQYEITGGENWDIDKDGLKDESPTPNSQIYRAIYKGKKSHVAWWGIQTEGVEKISKEL